MDWAAELLPLEGEARLGAVLALLRAALARAAASQGDVWETVFSETVLVAFAKVLKWLAADGGGLEAGGQAAKALRQEAAALVKVYSKAATRSPEGLEDLVEVLVVMVVKVVAEAVQEAGQVVVPTVLDQLGCIPSALLQAVVTAGARDLLAKELGARAEDDTAGAADLAAVLIINCVLGLKLAAEVEQQVEGAVAAKSMLMEEVEVEEKALLEAVQDRIRERRDGPAAA